MKIKKVITTFLSLVIITTVLTVNAFAYAQVTKSVRAVKNGTEGTAYSPCVAVNTTLYDGTLLAWSSYVENKPTNKTYTGITVTCKLYKNTSALSTLMTKKNVTVGNTTSTGTLLKLLGGTQKKYSQMNNKYKFYINVKYCPPAYKNLTSFDVGGIFYGYNK